MAMCLASDYKLIRSIKVSYEVPVFQSLTGWDPLVFSLYWPSQLSLIRTIYMIYIYIYITETEILNSTDTVAFRMQAPESKLVSFTSGHAFRAFDPHTPVTWSQNMISWLSSMMAWHGCPLPEPRCLLLCKGCPAKFRHTSHKCEKQMGQKPYTLKLTEVCVKTFKP